MFFPRGTYFSGLREEVIRLRIQPKCRRLYLISAADDVFPLSPIV